MLASISTYSSSSYTMHSHSELTAAKEPHKSDESKNDTVENTNSNNTTENKIQQLSKEDQLIVQKLKQRDLEVKAHEQAHLSAAGNLASGGASFTYTQGPNGVRYATAGEVNIDTSVVEGNPAATIRKADAIRRAAMAPLSPSSQDQLVAAKATAIASQAKADLSDQIQQQQKAESGLYSEQSSKVTSDASVSIKGSIIDIAA